jgi:Protein of unknown function (DUF2817)
MMMMSVSAAIFSMIVVAAAVLLAWSGVPTTIDPTMKFSDQVACQDYHYEYGNHQWKGNTCHVFSSSYEVARQRFREACPNDAAIALPVVSDDHQEEGDDTTAQTGVVYTMDVCVVPGRAPGLVVHVSGTHGIEGYAGSAIQIAYLANRRQNKEEDPTVHPTVVLIHAFNPYGMAKHRRFNENNVDLNRNGLSDAEWSTFAIQHWNYDTFERLRPFFVPSLVGTYFWPSVVKTMALAVVSIANYGIPTLKEAMVGGQYHDPSAIFYGGKKREVSYDVLDAWLQTFLPSHTTRDDVVTWIDVHTGLGKSGEDTLLTKADALNRHEICHWFNGTQCSVDDAASVNQGYEQVRGGVIDHIHRTHFASATTRQQPLLFVQEFGTIPLILVGLALILENAAHQQGLDWSLRTTRHAFYPPSAAWRIKTLQNGLRVIEQAKDRSRQLSATDAVQ